MKIVYHDIQISYEKYGNSKETIVILPGWGETKNTFYEIINYLQEYYTIYLIIYPGFSGSPFPPHDLSMFDYAEAVIHFLNTLKIKSPYVIAHSFGGRIAILLSSRYAIHIKRLILMDSAGIKPKRTLKKRVRTLLYKFLQSCADLLSEKRRKKVKQTLFKKFASTDYFNLSPNMRNTFKQIVNLDLTKYLPYIGTETLLIWGEKDLDTPIKDAYKMKKKIRGSEIITFVNGSHFCYLENPYVIIKIILSFFS